MKLGTWVFLLSLFFVWNSASAESFLRMRIYQQHPLWTNNTEKGSYMEGSTKTPMETNLQGWMLSYNMIGLGGSTTVTEFNTGDKTHSLTGEWQDIGLIFGVTRTSTLTLGTGYLSKGEGKLSYNVTEYIGSKVSGNSYFALFGLEYILPVNLDIIPFEYVEILVGYRENRMKYEGYQSGDISIDKALNVKSIQYLLGLGLVF